MFCGVRLRRGGCAGEIEQGNVRSRLRSRSWCRCEGDYAGEVEQANLRRGVAQERLRGGCCAGTMCKGSCTRGRVVPGRLCPGKLCWEVYAGEDVQETLRREYCAGETVQQGRLRRGGYAGLLRRGFCTGEVVQGNFCKEVM